MRNKINLAIFSWLIFTSCAYFSLALAQSTSFYQSSESFTTQGGCLTCNQGINSGSGSEISGTVGGDPSQNVAELSGNLSADVVTPTVSGGGGGPVYGSVVPAVSQNYATPTPQGTGGGYEMGTTTVGQPVPKLPNTALGDDQKLFYILIAGLVLLAEGLLVGRAYILKKNNLN